jgi:hypothetical protein
MRDEKVLVMAKHNEAAEKANKYKYKYNYLECLAIVFGQSKSKVNDK